MSLECFKHEKGWQNTHLKQLNVLKQRADSQTHTRNMLGLECIALCQHSTSMTINQDGLSSVGANNTNLALHEKRSYMML